MQGLAEAVDEVLEVGLALVDNADVVEELGLVREADVGGVELTVRPAEGDQRLDVLLVLECCVVRIALLTLEGAGEVGALGQEVAYLTHGVHVVLCVGDDGVRVAIGEAGLHNRADLVGQIVDARAEVAENSACEVGEILSVALGRGRCLEQCLQQVVLDAHHADVREYRCGLVA